MLPVLSKALRVTRPAEFTSVLRTGRRVGTKLFALHLLAPALSGSVDDRPGSPGPSGPSPVEVNPHHGIRPARVGFVVSAAVGNSVVRHRVTRQLREQMRPLLGDLPAGTAVVVRAFAASASASSAQLGHDLRIALTRVQSR